MIYGLLTNLSLDLLIGEDKITDGEANQYMIVEVQSRQAKRSNLVNSRIRRPKEREKNTLIK